MANVNDGTFNQSGGIFDQMTPGFEGSESQTEEGYDYFDSQQQQASDAELEKTIESTEAQHRNEQFAEQEAEAAQAGDDGYDYFDPQRQADLREAVEEEEAQQIETTQDKAAREDAERQAEAE